MQALYLLALEPAQTTADRCSFGFRPATGSRKRALKDLSRIRGNSHVRFLGGWASNGLSLPYNSHDGSSSYQMMAGMFRFVCANGMVCGDTLQDIRVRHNGDAVNTIIDGAYTVLESFETVSEQLEEMKSLTLNEGEQKAFARAALTLKSAPCGCWPKKCES